MGFDFAAFMEGLGNAASVMWNMEQQEAVNKFNQEMARAHLAIQQAEANSRIALNQAQIKHLGVEEGQNELMVRHKIDVDVAEQQWKTWAAILNLPPEAGAQAIAGLDLKYAPPSMRNFISQFQGQGFTPGQIATDTGVAVPGITPGIQSWDMSKNLANIDTSAPNAGMWVTDEGKPCPPGTPGCNHVPAPGGCGGPGQPPCGALGGAGLGEVTSGTGAYPGLTTGNIAGLSSRGNAESPIAPTSLNIQAPAPTPVVPGTNAGPTRRGWADIITSPLDKAKLGYVEAQTNAMNSLGMQREASAGAQEALGEVRNAQVPYWGERTEHVAGETTNERALNDAKVNNLAEQNAYLQSRSDYTDALRARVQTLTPAQLANLQAAAQEKDARRQKVLTDMAMAKITAPAAANASNARAEYYRGKGAPGTKAGGVTGTAGTGSPTQRISKAIQTDPVKAAAVKKFRAKGMSDAQIVSQYPDQF